MLALRSRSPLLRASAPQRSLATLTPPPAHGGHARFAPAPFLLEDVAPQLDAAALKALPQFTISRERGFLPRRDPIPNGAAMPRQWGTLDRLLDDMTIVQPDGSHGLLATGSFGDAVTDNIKPGGPELEVVERAIKDNDSHLISALHRDLCFAASAYLLEPADVSFRATGRYSLGREVLPAGLAVPLKKTGDALGLAPFMEYATSYALQNYKLKAPEHNGPAGKFSFENLELCRAFWNRGPGSESGFILVHVEMVGTASGKLVAGTEDALRGAETGDVALFEAGMERMLRAYQAIQLSMETMWSRSSPQEYMSLRTMIMGIKNNPMFPQGVVYEGVEEFGGKPQTFSGESGANDSLVPTGDNFLEITSQFPKNELTEELRAFRRYRPSTHQEYLKMLEMRAAHIGIRSFAMERSGSVKAKALYTLLVEQIAQFRGRHWAFSKNYIIKRTPFAIATGGTSMLQYLPHNLRVTLEVLEESLAQWSDADDAALRAVDSGLAGEMHVVAVRAGAQRRMLVREVEELASQVKEKDPRTAGMALPAQSGHTPTRGAVGCDGVG